MDDLTTASSFKDAAKPTEKLDLNPATLAWFKERGASWQQEIEGVLDFYIHTQLVSEPDGFEPGEMHPAPDHPAP